MSEQAVVGEGTEVNKGENARMASFVGALAIGTWTIKLPHWTCLVFQYFIPIFFERFEFPIFQIQLALSTLHQSPFPSLRYPPPDSSFLFSLGSLSF